MIWKDTSGFYPIQPTIKSRDRLVTYEEISPAEDLRSLIYCYWRLKTEDSLQSPFLYRVVSDGCIDIFFNVEKPKESFVMGFSRKYTVFPLEKEFYYAGIRFYPAAFPYLFEINANILSNTYVNLDTILPQLASYINDIKKPNPDLLELKKFYDGYFSTLIYGLDKAIDPRFLNALSQIIKNFGVLQIENDIQTGLSPRQLRRFFSYYIGTSPKSFARVVRFQNILRAKPSLQSLKKSKIFYDIGYYNQAHFIKDFKSFYGVTPSQAFR